MIRIPGSHEPNCKNRSSKQHFWLTKCKPFVRSMSNEMLEKAYDGLMSGAVRRELARRRGKNAKADVK